MSRSYKIHRLTIKWFIIIVLINVAQQTRGQRVKLLPLTAPEIYKVLRDSGKSDVVPEGRIVTQGIAAAAGFTVGLKKALAGIFVYDVITANITEPAETLPVLESREICFGSRLSRSLKDAEAIAKVSSRLEQRGLEPEAEVRQSDQMRHRRPLRKNKRGLKNRKRNFPRRRFSQRPKNNNGSGRAGDKIISLTGSTGTQDTNTAISGVTTPSSTASGSNVGLNSGLWSNLAATGSAANDDPITCVVLQQLKQST